MINAFKLMIVEKRQGLEQRWAKWNAPQAIVEKRQGSQIIVEKRRS